MDFLPNIVYHNDQLLLVRKPHGIASSRGQEKCFLDIIKKCCSDTDSSLREETTKQSTNDIQLRKSQISAFGESEEYGLLNRLDNVTAGLLYFARSPEAKASYLQLQEQGLITKTYYAQVIGTPHALFGWISTPLYHHRDDASRMTTDEHKGRGKAQEAVTYWEKIMNYELGIMNSCLLKIQITSGCRHQIRCHLASIGHPILGDKLYMSKKMRKEMGEVKGIPKISGQVERIELVSAGVEIKEFFSL